MSERHTTLGAIAAIFVACGGSIDAPGQNQSGRGGNAGTLGAGSGAVESAAGTAGGAFPKPDAGVGGTSDAPASGGSSAAGAGAVGGSAARDSGSEDAADASDSAQCTIGPDHSAFLDQFPSAYCDGLASCCAALALRFDLAACRSNVRNFVTPIVSRAACTRPSLEASAVEQCVLDIGLYAKKCVDDPSLEAKALESCARILSPVGKKLGDSCETKLDCPHPPGTDVTCLIWDFGTLCQERRIVGENEPCNRFGHESVNYRCDLSAGLWCDLDTNRCRRAPVVGESCVSQSCAPAYFCLDEVCARRPALGQSCASSEYACPEGAYCDAASTTCLELKPVGASCANYFECVTDRCESSKCLPRNDWAGVLARRECY